MAKPWAMWVELKQAEEDADIAVQRYLAAKAEHDAAEAAIAALNDTIAAYKRYLAPRRSE